MMMYLHLIWIDWPKMAFLLMLYCPAPICGPSRTAILSGMRPVTSGVYDNNIKFSKDLPNVVTLI